MQMSVLCIWRSYQSKYLLSVRLFQQVGKRTVLRFLECQQRQRTFQFAQHLGIRFARLRHLCLGKCKGFFDFSVAYQFNQMQLLQMEIEEAIVVQQFRMQLIHQMRSLLHASTLHCLPYENAIVQRV